MYDQNIGMQSRLKNTNRIRPRSPAVIFAAMGIAVGFSATLWSELRWPNTTDRDGTLVAQGPPAKLGATTPPTVTLTSPAVPSNSSTQSAMAAPAPLPEANAVEQSLPLASAVPMPVARPMARTVAGPREAPPVASVQDLLGQ